MKIYTKKGDQGNTSLLGGSRVPKFHLRIEAYGTIDELNSYMGLIGDQAEVVDFLPLIRNIQHELFTLGSHLANDPQQSRFVLPDISADSILALEESIDNMNTQLPELKNFVLAGGHIANSFAHVARSVCRRAERRVVELHTQEPISTDILAFLNRLSDWLFVLARYITFRSQSAEILWQTRS
ncbi:MAG: cob(I)yrinic acid a,c-diamide adenosyltransferase [Bacteroidota bacterium]